MLACDALLRVMCVKLISELKKNIKRTALIGSQYEMKMWRSSISIVCQKNGINNTNII